MAKPRKEADNKSRMTPGLSVSYRLLYNSFQTSTMYSQEIVDSLVTIYFSLIEVVNALKEFNLSNQSFKMRNGHT